MALIDVIEEVVDSMAADGLSPFPGFFTAMTIASAVLSRGWQGKGETNEFNQRGLSPRQIQEVERILDSYFEKQMDGKKAYYGQRVRR